MNPAPLLQDLLGEAAERLPDKVALVAGGERRTYGWIEQSARALAAALRARGVERGDRVLVFGENSVEVVVSFWAALLADAVAVVLSPQTRADKLAYVLRDCRPAAVVTQAPLARTLTSAVEGTTVRCCVVTGDASAESALPGLLGWDEALAGPTTALPRRNLDVDLAALVYTSGSTGEPKGVMLTHRNMLTAAASIGGYLRLDEDEVVFCALPLSFDYGLYQVLLSAQVGARVVLERSFAFPVQALKVIVEQEVTALPGVPTMFAMLAELKDLSAWDLSRIRVVTNTAAALPVKHIHLLQRLFPRARIFSMYGLTECKRCTYLPPEDLARKPESVGVAIPNTELWVVDDEDRRLGPRQVGQLVIRGATVMRGYWEKPEATARRLRPGPLPGEQVLYTGDLCFLDEEGYLYFVARMDDVIKSRGEKVAPKEVESALVDVPGVKEAAVVGVPHEVLGGEVKAFVVLEAGARLTPKELQRECQRRLEPFKVPSEVELVAELPRTSTGKVRKAGLR